MLQKNNRCTNYGIYMTALSIYDEINVCSMLYFWNVGFYQHNWNEYSCAIISFLNGTFSHRTLNNGASWVQKS